ncbi:hypothetical protein SDRG_16484, partial [Saprolegnia diclina VS20]
METPVAPLWYIGVFVGHFAMYGAAYGISLLKAKLLPSYCPVLEKNALPIVATVQGMTIVALMWVQITIASIVAASYLSTGLVLHRAHQHGLEADVATLTFTSRGRYYLQLALRLLVVTLFCIILVIDAQEYGTTALSYYTIWNFALQTVYHALAAGFLLSHWRARDGASVVVKSRPLNSLFDICLTNSLLVAVVFWTELYYPTMPWYSYVQHGVNTVLFVLELFLGDFDVQSEDFKYAGMSPTIYTTFIWISHDTWLH